MDSIKPPMMDFENGNVAENWKMWCQHMQLLLTGPLAEKKDEQKSSYFLLYIGQTGRDIYNTWYSPEDTKPTVEELITKFSEYCKPKKNTIMARFKFNSRVQKANENTDQFVTDLRLISQECEYGELRDSLIRDRIIFGTKDNKIRERLLQDEDTKLDKAIEIARSIEATTEQMTNLHCTPPSAQDVNIQAIKRTAQRPMKPRPSRQQNHQSKPKINQCLNCGGPPHHFSKCPAT